MASPTLKAKLAKKLAADLKKVKDVAGLYKDRRRMMKNFNQLARALKRRDLETEQDHMPPKSSIEAAYNRNKKNKLAEALYGDGKQDNMLAMTYLKAEHRDAATTGTQKQIEAVRNKITETIVKGNVVDTYKYTVLATNTGDITTTKRNFEGYAEAYINRLKNNNKNNSVVINQNQEDEIRNWTKKVLRNEQKTKNDPHFQTLDNVFYDDIRPQ